jgi:hypothetical protein
VEGQTSKDIAVSVPPPSDGEKINDLLENGWCYYGNSIQSSILCGCVELRA